MRRALSKQRGVKFVFGKSPMTIDKTKEWGDDPSNHQNFPNGGFLKINEDNTISHGVQPNADNSAPVGWTSNGDGTYDKSAIWVDESRVYTNGEKVPMQTLDGPINYTAAEPAVKVYNGDEQGPNLNDGWLMEAKGLEKNYDFKLAKIDA